METNIKLRSEVLEYALTLELSISSIIKAYFFIGKEKLRAINNKSGGLSFKSQVDLLYDFEIITDEEYNSLIKLMEFRNQFMHNYHCNSFVKAVEFIGSDRGKFLLSYVKPSEKSLDIEIQYLNGYRNCFLDLQKQLVDKFQKREDDISFKADLMKHYNNKIIKLIDKHFAIMKKISQETLLLLHKHKVDKAIVDEFIEQYKQTIQKEKFGKFRDRKKFKVTDNLINKILK